MTPIELMLGMLIFAGFSKFYGRDPKAGKFFFFAAAVSASFSEFLSSAHPDQEVSGDFMFDITALLLAWFGAWKVITSK